ncbi:hypothetical protein Naga_100038g2 [Nannochloropsis gaditana]|uniref:Uncharacterized protein n=1 Tax=Nannochloropsis gaditana TaxID=72520 RepID=W7TJI0_9STRA|nr:hypothetical protein Naga_100038g2 [Nannochloropsis gaditana]
MKTKKDHDRGSLFSNCFSTDYTENALGWRQRFDYRFWSTVDVTASKLHSPQRTYCLSDHRIPHILPFVFIYFFLITHQHDFNFSSHSVDVGGGVLYIVYLMKC